MSSTLSSASLTTGNTTTVSTTTTQAPPPAFFQTSDGRVVLTFLILIFLLLIATPIIVYVLVRKFCWIKVHNSGKGEWQTRPVPSAKDRNRKTQTDVIGIELDEFYRRRQPIDMSKYVGKKISSDQTEEQSRWHKLNPKKLNDPWSEKYPGKETNYVEKVW